MSVGEIPSASLDKVLLAYLDNRSSLETMLITLPVVPLPNTSGIVDSSIRSVIWSSSGLDKSIRNNLSPIALVNGATASLPSLATAVSKALFSFAISNLVWRISERTAMSSPLYSSAFLRATARSSALRVRSSARFSASIRAIFARSSLARSAAASRSSLERVLSSARFSAILRKV